MTRHRNSKHKTESTNIEHRDKPTEVEFQSEHLHGLIKFSQEELSTNKCYPETLRESITNYAFWDNGNKLFEQIHQICCGFSENYDAENFYTMFYGKVVMYASTYFPGLGLPMCTLLATKLCDKVLTKLKQNNTTSESKNTLSINITDRELDGLQYLGGYVVSKLLKKVKNSPKYNTAENQFIISILTNAKSEDIASQKLINTLNRGGLCAVTPECLRIFKITETVFRETTHNSKLLQKIDCHEMVQKLLKDVDVISCFNSLVAGP